GLFHRAFGDHVEIQAGVPLRPIRCQAGHPCCVAVVDLRDARRCTGPRDQSGEILLLPDVMVELEYLPTVHTRTPRVNGVFHLLMEAVEDRRLQQRALAAADDQMTREPHENLLHDDVCTVESGTDTRPENVPAYSPWIIVDGWIQSNTVER